MISIFSAKLLNTTNSQIIIFEFCYCSKSIFLVLIFKMQKFEFALGFKFSCYLARNKKRAFEKILYFICLLKSLLIFAIYNSLNDIYIESIKSIIKSTQTLIFQFSNALCMLRKFLTSINQLQVW